MVYKVYLDHNYRMSLLPTVRDKLRRAGWHKEFNQTDIAVCYVWFGFFNDAVWVQDQWVFVWILL